MSTKPVSIARSSDAEPPPRRRVEVILAELERLPALSAVAVELLSLTTSEVSSARDVVRVIESDASLTATVLRMARRCDLGISGRVTPVDRVVTLLGFKAVRNAALSVHLYETLGALEGGAESLRKGFWKHSLGRRLRSGGAGRTGSSTVRPVGRRSSAACCTIWGRRRWMHVCPKATPA